ncbi:MAG TPA: HIT family protein [Pyrinomonadaceae bacterium]|jgi:histidine triad (HIT) family protein|nr:HIT family protein [Pyrinomonadaceae bacterium]
MTDDCLFCRIVSGELPATVVYEDENALAFLDYRPLFPGHTLLVPRQHVETLGDLETKLVGPYFEAAQLLARAIESAMDAEGTFVAMNNRVSQSVPHLHVHVVPRRKKDGLKGFFWPRTKYKADEEMEEVRSKIAAALMKLKTKK